MTTPNTPNPNTINVKPALIQHEHALTRRDMLALVKSGEIVIHATAGSSVVRCDVRVTLHAECADDSTRRALVDALTRDLAERYEDGYSVEDGRYEPGSSEWVGWVVGNADRIEVSKGRMLGDLTSEERRAWVAEVIEGREEVRVFR